MESIVTIYPAPQPAPLRVGDFLSHQGHGLCMVTQGAPEKSEDGRAKVGVVCLYSGKCISGGKRIWVNNPEKLAPDEVLDLLGGTLDGWSRFTKQEAGEDLRVPF